jgi:H+/Cl- antiporter ClcA
MKSFFLVLPLLAILGITLWWAVSAWNAVDVEMSIHGYMEMSIHGYIAMILGIVFSLVLGCGLMALQQPPWLR